MQFNPVQNLIVSETSNTWYGSIIVILATIYIIGCLYYSVKFLRGLWKIAIIIRKHDVIDKGSYKLIKLEIGPSYFSFLTYLFLNEGEQYLRNEELRGVIAHEKIHIQQKHTVDIILMELVAIFCWFNPVVKKIKNAIRQTHEFIADKYVVSNTISIEEYSRLILKLSSSRNPIPYTHQFSMINTKNRIIMLNQSKQHAMKSLKFLLTVPLVVLFMTLFSFTERPIASSANNSNSISSDNELIIGKISWMGNTKYSDATLNEVLGIKKGDIYDEKLTRQKLSFNPNGKDISSLYLDNGHLFSNVVFKEDVIGNTINLNFEIYEGVAVTIDKIAIKGNNRIKSAEIMKMITLKSGDIFDRSKLIKSSKMLVESGYFKPDDTHINPIPHDDTLVDIEFVLVEL